MCAQAGETVISRQIGIYSGTFDPFHEGHALFIDVVAEQFGLDHVLIIPEARPRYKQNATPLEDRLEMAQLGTQDLRTPVTILNTVDLPQHTIRGLIEKVNQLHPEDEYYVVLGADVFKNAPTWGERDDEDGSVSDIADHVGFVVGIESMNQLEELRTIGKHSNLNVRFIEMPLAGMSSRIIRKQLANRKQPHGLHDDVHQYATKNALYDDSI